PCKVSSKERGFLATFATFDFQDDIAGVVWVTRNEQSVQSFRGLVVICFKLWNLCGKVVIFLGEFTSIFEILAKLLPTFVGLDDLFELSKASSDFTGEGLVCVDGWVAHLFCQFGVFV